MNHKAVYALYPQVVMVDDGAGAFDAEGNKVEIDMDAVAVEAERLAQVTVKQARISKLQNLLRETDYVALSDYDKDKPEVIAQRAAWRAEIRQLETN
jgi:hypothetical protein